MTTTALRLINLIQLLQRRPNLASSELAQELSVSRRTIQRYITMLEELGIPVYAERGARGGYALARGFKMPPLIFSPEEAVAIYVGTRLLEDLWGQLFRSPAQSALNKIENVLPRAQLEEIDWAKQSLITVRIGAQNPNLEPTKLDVIYRATRQRQQLEIDYQARMRPEINRRVIEPYVLVYSWGHQYCIAYCQLRQAIRSFRLDRIRAISPLNNHFPEPKDFNLDQYWKNSPLAQSRQQVRLRFAPDKALIAREYQSYWDSLEEQVDGSIIASFSSIDLEGAARVVLGLCQHAKVLEPIELRQQVLDAAHAAINLQSSD